MCVKKRGGANLAKLMRYTNYNTPLKKAWMAYKMSESKNDLKGKQYYAGVIQNLEREQGKTVTQFHELKILALEYYSKNAEVFKDGVTGEEILKKMTENRYKFGKQ
jgi:hypothetical protein